MAAAAAAGVDVTGGTVWDGAPMVGVPDVWGIGFPPVVSVGAAYGTVVVGEAFPDGTSVAVGIGLEYCWPVVGLTVAPPDPADLFAFVLTYVM